MENYNRLNRILKKILAGASVLVFATFIDFENSPGWEKLGILTSALKLSSLLISIIIFLLALIFILSEKYKPSKTALAILMFYGFVAVVTLINGYSVTKRGLLGNLAFVLLFDMLLTWEDTCMFKGVLNMMNILTVLNFVSIIFAPANGFLRYVTDLARFSGGHYLLGYDNGIIIILLPTICFDLMLYSRKKRKLNLIIAILGIASVFIYFSATSIVVLAVMAVVYLVCRRRAVVRDIMTKKEVFIIGVVLLYGIYILTDEFQFLSDLMLSLFNKDTVSSNRVSLIAIGLQYVRKRWLTGYGYLVDRRWIGGFNSPHNLLVNIMLAGGTIGLFLFLRIIWVTLSQGRKYLLRGKSCLFPFAAITGILFASLTEGYDTYISFCFLWSLFLSVGNWKGCDSLLNHL